MRIRLSREKRKKQIKEIARSVFLKNGISNTTMKDIIEATGLSVGGMYHHYKNPLEIFYEIMSDGNKARFESIKKILSTDSKNKKTSLRTLEDKIINDGENAKLYAIFLAETIANKDLEDIYQGLMLEGMEDFNSLMEDPATRIDLVMDEFKLAMINTLIVGYQISNHQKVFKDNKERFREIINFIFFDENGEDYES